MKKKQFKIVSSLYVCWKSKLFLTMRLTVLALCLTVFQGLALTISAQNAKLNLKMEKSTIKQVLNSIEEKTDYYFLYNSLLVNVEQKVSIDVTNESIGEVLAKVFSGTDIKYEIQGRQVLLSSNENLIMQQSQIKVSGKVTDSSGTPLPGVTVVVKGTSNGIITDFNGNYNLSNIPANAILVFSFVGLKTQEIAVSGKILIDVVMEEDAIGIEEVIAVGYGSQKKESLTGAVDQVKMDEILGSRPVSSAATAIQGTIPGVQITAGSGQPGESPSIRIRGIESINGGEPLILVDNVPMNIDDINPADIESISVLKDASASSIYGGRAAFGVILINTKKGKRNQPIKFNYTANFAISNAIELPEKASTLETITAIKDFGDENYWTGQNLETWSNLLTEYKANPSKYPDGETSVNGILYRLEESDLYKAALNNSFEQLHNFSFTGGSERTDYRVSFGYADEDGILVSDKDSYTKFNVNIYISSSLTDKLTLSSNILYDNIKRTTPSNYSYLWNNIVESGRFINHGYHVDGDSRIPFYTANNMLKIEPANSNPTADIRIFEKLEYRLLKDLKITGEYTFINSVSDNITLATKNIYYDLYDYVPVPVTARAGGGKSYYNRFHGSSDYHALNLYANFEKKVKSHSFKLLAGMNQELKKYSDFWARKIDLLSSDIPSLATASGNATTNESFDETAISGYFSRLNYNYKEKYLLEANIRYDGSSKFPKGSRFGWFPSVSAGWVITEESFMKPVENIFNFVKLRGSYGDIGNQDIASYAYIPGMSSYLATWIDPGTSTLAQSLSVPDLVSSSFTWETVRTKNIGIDMGFLKNSLNVNFDYYIRKTLNMLAAGSELPAVIGAPAPLQNVADLKSKGWELGINWRINKNDFKGSFGINISDDRGFITKFKNEGGLLSQYYEGYEFGEIWGYVTDGYYTVDDFVNGSLNSSLMNGTLKENIPAYYTLAKTNPGDIRYVDLDDNGKISPGSSTLSDPGDRKIIGNSNRRYQFGINGNLSYKNFDFSFLLQGVGKRDIWIDNESFWPWIRMYDCFYKHQLDYWTPENSNGYYPRMYPQGGGNTSISRLPQTKYLLNGAYLRVKNIEFGYTLPQHWNQKLSIDRLRFFVSGENLLKLDHAPKGVDTELSSLSNLGGAYPYIRKFSFGLNLTF